MLYYSIIAATVIVLSPQDNKCNIIYSSLFINDGRDFYMYIYIYIYMHVYWYNSFVILLMLHFIIYVYSMVYKINHILYGWMMGMVRIYCLFSSPPSAAVDCYIWWLYVYWNSGVMNNIFSNGNHKNVTNTTAPSSSLWDNAVAVAVASSLKRHVYTVRYS